MHFPLVNHVSRPAAYIFIFVLITSGLVLLEISVANNLDDAGYYSCIVESIFSLSQLETGSNSLLSMAELSVLLVSL
jgi:hypothetical protein